MKKKDNRHEGEGGTKERITAEALNLFSVNGYKGTSIQSIADAVGVKGSSLYKHFHSKKDILDSAVELVKQHISNVSSAFGLPEDADLEESAALYKEFDENRLVEFSKNIFLFYLNDPIISKFWRMGNIEQYQNEEVHQVFSQLFLTESLTYQSALFGQMVKNGAFREVDPDVIAMNFYAPIFLLLSKYAGQTGKEEEALQVIEKQVREFYRIYRNQQ